MPRADHVEERSKQNVCQTMATPVVAACSPTRIAER
jgi:hypothetical protein